MPVQYFLDIEPGKVSYIGYGVISTAIFQTQSRVPNLLLTKLEGRTGIISIGSRSFLYGPRCARSIYSCFEKRCRKKAHAAIPKGNLGYDQQGTFLTLAVEPTFVAFF